MKCCYTRCPNKGILFCVCDPRNGLICGEHFAWHLNDLSKIHKLFPSIKVVENDSKEELLYSIKSSLNYLNEIKHSILDSINKIIDIGTKSLKRIESLIEYMKRLLREIIIKNQATIIPSSNRKLRKNILNQSMLKVSIKDGLKYSRIGDLIMQIEDLKSDLLRIENPKKHKKNSEILPFFMNDNTKNLFIMDVINETLLKKELKNIDIQGKRGGILVLKNQKIFCYGGALKESLSSAFLIDMKNYSTTNLPNGVPRASFTPIEDNNKIFCFGGWHLSTALKSADYFDLIENKWVKISDLPYVKSDTSTVKVGNEILISGHISFLQIYNIKFDSYKNINPGIEITSHNIIIKYKKTIYLLSKKVHYSKKHKLKKWISYPEKIVSFSMISCVPVIRKDSAYFIDMDLKIWEFNFFDLGLKLIHQVK